jgi:hypothetical protein
MVPAHRTSSLLDRNAIVNNFSLGDVDFDELSPVDQSKVATALSDTIIHYYEKSFDMSKVEFDIKTTDNELFDEFLV